MNKYHTKIVVTLCSLLAAICYVEANAGAVTSTPVAKETVDACSTLKEGDSCYFMKDSIKMDGTCQKGQDAKLVCDIKQAKSS